MPRPTVLIVLATLLLTRPPGVAAQEAAAPSPEEAEARQQEAERAATSALVQQGNQARQEGRLQDALDAYRSAANLAPRRYEIRILLGDTLRRVGRDDEAQAAYKAAVALDARRAEGHTGQAILKRAEYDFEGAVAIIEAALPRAAGRDRADLLVTLAETRRRQGRIAAAARGFQEAIDGDPRCAAAHAGLARLAEERGDLDGALAEWDRYLALEPDDGAAVLRRLEIREMRAAIAALAAAAATAPRGRAGGEVWAELGRLRAIAGDAAGAAAAWRAALKRDPEAVDWRRGLAVALENAGDRDAATAEFRRLLAAVPADGIALYHLAALTRESGDRRAEEEAWETLVARRPDDLYGGRALAAFVERADPEARARALARLPPGSAGLRRRALLLADAGAWDEVETTIEEALLIDATDPWTLDVLGDLLTRRPAILAGLAERARRRLLPAAAPPADAAPPPADPTPALLVLARCHALAGHADQARAILDRVVAARPDSAVARSALAETLQAPGRKPQPAIEALERAIALDPGRLAAHVDLTLVLLRSGRPADAEAAARRGLERHPGAAPLLSLLGAARADQQDAEGAARAFAAALTADPADNFHLARGQYPLVLAGLGRTLEARRALRGLLPELPDLAYLEAWGFARDTYRDRTFNGQDWMAARARSRDLPAAADPAAAHRAIADLLGALADPYTRLRDPEETAAVWLTRHSGRSEVDALGRNRPSGASVATGELPGGLGYVQIANLTDPNAIADLRRALKAMGDKEGLVLDLRGNPGGLTRSADAAADLLIGPGVEVGEEAGPDGRVDRVTGGDGAITDQPITVLVDGQTASAAERLASSLAAAGRATVVGAPTHGKGVFQTSRVLPGGHTVLVSTGESLEPGGGPIQGRGVRPRPPAPQPPQKDDAPAAPPGSP